MTGGEEMKKYFGLVLSAVLLFTLGFPTPSFSQVTQTTEQSASFEEVESFIQQAYQMRTNAVTNPGILSLLSKLYASSSSKLQEYEQRRAEFWRNWGNLYGQVLSFTSTISLIPGTLKQQNDLTFLVQAREILTITWKPNLRTGMEYWEKKLANYAGNQVMVWPGMYGTQWWYDHHGTYDTSDDTYSFNWINTYLLDCPHCADTGFCHRWQSDERRKFVSWRPDRPVEPLSCCCCGYPRQPSFN